MVQQAAAKNAKAPPQVNMGKGPSGEDLPDFDKWDKIQTGFAPYWWPEVGKFFFGELIAKDARNPEFVRYLVKAWMDHDCRRGPMNDDKESGATGEPVAVKSGDTFSISVYHSLAEEFDYQLYLRGKGVYVPVRVKAEKKTSTNTTGRSVWHFDMRNDPKITPQLNAHREEYRQLVQGEQGTRELES